MRHSLVWCIDKPSETILCRFAIVQLTCRDSFFKSGVLYQFFSVECLVPCIHIFDRGVHITITDDAIQPDQII